MINRDIKERILVLDGALGTMIQGYNLSQDDFHGERFYQWKIDLKGCNDILVFTQPAIIEEIHRLYLEAGADIITTNSFNANAISMAEYGLADQVYELNYTSALLARAAIEKGGFKGRYVAGSVGPTGRAASISPVVEDAACRNITFEELTIAYREQIGGLIDGGVDIILIETAFDTLNAKAALAAHDMVCVQRERFVPVMLSGTITDSSGRTLSGQTVEAFYYSTMHSPYLLSIGLNCSFGAELIFDFLRRLEGVSANYVSVHPNAGLPDSFGNYTHTPEYMASIIEKMMQEGLLNIVGGCCGTTPDHIKAIAQLAKRYAPRVPHERDGVTTLTGLEPLRMTPSLGFINVGERANVAGSAKFARLIREKAYDEALSVVESQIESGASVIDICMDAPMIDAREAMQHFLRLVASEPDIARLPLMIDSSSWEVLECGLQSVQGKSIVNSISLKEGEEAFLRKAFTVQRYGAAVVVMLFDEQGQADSYDRKVEVATRAYRLLVDNGFAAEDIIFDPNVLTIATGMSEHDNYAVDFIEAVRYIKSNLPGAKVSGGVSNLSFSFRGNNIVREAMHSVFLYHAIGAGMDMAIVNAATLVIYEDIEPSLLKAVEDVVLNRDGGATERLIELASAIKAAKSEPGSAAHAPQTLEWREQEVDQRIAYWMVRGINEFVEVDINESLAKHGEAVKVIEGALMDGMKQVGELFSKGKMFLPQVVKSARVMKRAVDILSPHISGDISSSVGKVVIATVKGDVHDIGKNIVSIVLSCNGFEVIDLGVMVAPEAIIEAVLTHKPSILALSGLITPSLDEMATVIKAMEREGQTIPIFIGGATTSRLHTAVKLAPLYSCVVVNTPDASSCAKLTVEVTGSDAAGAVARVQEMQQQRRDSYYEGQQQSRQLSMEEARARGAQLDFSSISTPNMLGQKTLSLPLDEVKPLIGWSQFFSAWEISGRIPAIFDHPEKGVEARKLYDDALSILEQMREVLDIRATFGIYDARRDDETITIIDGDRSLSLAMARKMDAAAKVNYSLADFIAPEGDYLGLMTLSVCGSETLLERYKDDAYSSLLVQTLCDRLAEAASEYLHYKIRSEYWGYSSESLDVDMLLRGSYQGIRPAFGYPSLPDHSQKADVFRFMNVEGEIGATLTENYAMMPVSSICAMIFAAEGSCYFVI